MSKNDKAIRNGKEESYERNPGRVPFVLNPKFFRTFQGLKNLLRLAKIPFRQPAPAPFWGGGFAGRQIM